MSGGELAECGDEQLDVGEVAFDDLSWQPAFAAVGVQVAGDAEPGADAGIAGLGDEASDDGVEVAVAALGWRLGEV